MNEAVINKLIEVRTRSAKEEVHFAYITEMLKTMQTSETEPEITEGGCFAITYIEDDKDAAIHNLAGMLVWKDKVGHKLTRCGDTIYLETN